MLIATVPPPPSPLKAGDITYDKDRIVQGVEDTATASSETITDLSILTFSIASITPYDGTGTQERPIIKDGNITTTATTTAGSYRVTITPDGSTYAGDPLTVDFYVTTKPADIAALDTTLETAITNYGLTGDFNYIDTSAITNMSHLFRSGTTPGTGAENTVNTGRTYVQGFNGDISKWDVAAVADFSAMFYYATAFNQDIGGWNVSTGTDFGGMFSGAAAFNQDISKWNVAAVKDFSWMFQEAASFNQNISGWNVSAGETFNTMFFGAIAFNQDLSNWNVAPTATTTGMFFNSGVVNPESYTWYP